MDTESTNAFLATLGFKGPLAAQAAASFPLYGLTFAAVKKWALIPRRFEMLFAAALTAVLNVSVALGTDVEVFPALSACASGAWLAMLVHTVWVKPRVERRTAAREGKR